MPNGPGKTDVHFLFPFPFFFYPLVCSSVPVCSRALTLFLLFIFHHVTVHLSCSLLHEFSPTYSILFIRAYVLSFPASLSLSFPLPQSKSWHSVQTQEFTGDVWVHLHVWDAYINVCTFAHGSTVDKQSWFCFLITSWWMVTVNKVSVCEGGMKASSQHHSTPQIWRPGAQSCRQWQAVEVMWTTPKTVDM